MTTAGKPYLFLHFFDGIELLLMDIWRQFVVRCREHGHRLSTNHTHGEKLLKLHVIDATC